MNKITIEFDDINKTKTQQQVKIHTKLNTNTLSLASAINELVEELTYKTGSDLLDAMIYLCKQDKKELCEQYEEDDDLLFGDCDNGD